jgi:hypothetical protein
MSSSETSGERVEKPSAHESGKIQSTLACI